MITVENLAGLYALATPADGDMVYVRGYRDKDDGGGGFFIFDASSILEPVFQVSNIADPQFFEAMLGVGYNANYDGMVCRAKDITNGRWIRQWNRGKLNLRWFGGAPGGLSDGMGKEDASPALNAALKYAQFDVPIRQTIPNSDPVQYIDPPEYDPEVTVFNSKDLTRPGKTIYIPSGRYYFRTFISTITYGVVIEGEGNVGTSANGTRLLIFHRFNDFNILADSNDPNSSVLPFGNNSGAFLRFYANGENSSGGGIKDLTIDVPTLPMTPEQKADPHFVNEYGSNIVSLISPGTVPPNGVDLPAVAKWKAENVVMGLRARAKRAIYMKSGQRSGGTLHWRIRDIALINCWFAGASVQGETVRAENVSGLHVIGGLFSSGLGLEHPTDPSLPALRVTPGILLTGIHGCANTHLNSIDLTNGIIQIDKKSTFINIDCRFAKLLIYNGPGNDHEALHISKRYILNKRNYPALDPSGNPNTIVCSIDTPPNFNCYNNVYEIECDTDANWMHNQPCPTT